MTKYRVTCYYKAKEIIIKFPKSNNIIHRGEACERLHVYTGLLCYQIPLDLYKIELTQVIQVFGALASTVTLQLGASL